MASGHRPSSRSDVQVQDRIYFVGIVHLKISELESEMQRLQRATDSFVEDNKQYIALSKTAEELSQQTEDLRNEFEDYNMARMNSFCDVTELKKEIDDLHAHNQQLESTIDEIYLEKRRKEERIQQLEYELSDKKSNAEKLLEKRNPEISIVENQMKKIREQVSGSMIEQEALSLIDQIYELELKHDQLLNENKTFDTSEEQTLTTQIEDDNQEFASIEQQIIEIQQYNENLQQLSNDDLEETREKCLNDIKNLQKTNLTLLSFISRALMTTTYTQLKVNSDQYEIEKQNSNNTLIILAEQHRKVKQDFIKLETLDQRLTDELQELKLKYSKMQEDLVKFNDLESLKRKAERRKQQLIADKTNMIKQKQITQIEIQTLQSQSEAMQTQLHDNETYQQFITLEKKLQTLLTLDEELPFQNQYEQIKHQALNLVYAHNQWLIQRLKNLC